MIFDDTYQHEVWNDTDGHRVVLFLDIVRPFAQPVAALNDLIIQLVTLSPFVQNAKKNQIEWDAHHPPPVPQNGVEASAPQG